MRGLAANEVEEEMIEEAPGFIFTVAVFLAALTVLVFVHEFGHYIVARWCKVKVEVFSIGFGRELYGWNDKNGTRWKFSAIPLGGYVKFFGDSTGASNPDDDALGSMTAEERAVSFHYKTLWQRAAIVFAGPFVNIIFAIFLFAGLVYVNGVQVVPSEIGIVEQNSSAEKAGLKFRDIVRSIDGTTVERFRDINAVVQLLPGQTVDFEIERSGQIVTLPVTIDTRLMKDRFDNEYEYGNLRIWPQFSSMIGKVLEGTPAHTSGLMPNDIITNIDGENIEYFQSVSEVISTRANKTIAIQVERDGELLDLVVTIGERNVAVEGEVENIIGYIGIELALSDLAFDEHVEFGVVGALVEGTRQSISTLRMITTTMGQLVMGMRSVKEMAGPVRMATMVGEVAQRGFEDLIILLAMISINLGFVNLLPIPMLDGGHLLFYGLEAAKGGPLPKRAQEWAFMLGFVFVIGFMLFLTLNDLHSIAL